jgi:hypothetical protein
MGSLLNSGEVGNIGLEHLKQIRTKTMTKWNDLGFLDGLKGHIKENVAQLFENQASSLLTESTDGSSSGSFETVVFPIVRRVFSKLLANDIVSVQAMNMPIGKLFYFVPKVSVHYHQHQVLQMLLLTNLSLYMTYIITMDYSTDLKVLLLWLLLQVLDQLLTQLNSLL